jgi:hypothetical protein
MALCVEKASIEGEAVSSSDLALACAATAMELAYNRLWLMAPVHTQAF